MLKRLLTLATHKIYSLPVLVMMPHSRCNCRCVMCDIWKANQNKTEISFEELQKHMEDFKRLNVLEIVFSGGEALMHTNLWKLCTLLKENKIRITLLSTGLLLENNAQTIISHIDNVIVSLDGSENVHDKIRNIPEGYKKIARGIAALKKINPRYKITARSVVQRLNYNDFPNTVRSAKSIGLDSISFLAADVSTSAFNHTSGTLNGVALQKNDVIEFEKILEQSFVELRDEYESGFIAESPEKMRRVLQYYKALNGEGNYPKINCNAPWVSAVVESNGDVMPCFFHKPYGNIHQQKFTDIINSREAVTFREKLDMATDNICSKCVCSLKLSPLQMR
jgi:MoaA/NifB/PqqE/SkfB family radical SAM enzyme